MNHLQGHYDGMIVLLSVLIAVAASYSALNLAGKISHVKGRSRTIWLFVGSFVMGIGVWSMHFVGMLAFHLGMAVQYHIPITLVSMVASISASFVAFRVTSTPDAGVRQIVPAGLYMGSGIVAMHYIGMAAIRKPIVLHYNILYCALSVIVALAASYAALFLFLKLRNTFGFSKLKLLCAVLMGAAICGMHYTGMLATEFSLEASASPSGNEIMDNSQSILLIGVAIATFVMLGISWGVVFFDRTVLERMAYNDALTGLLNRHQLVRYFETSYPAKDSGFLLFIDLDRFKTINDTLGHDAGDLFIKEVASRIKQTTSGDDTVFRLGGDEFLVASARGKRKEAAELAERLIAVIKQPYSVLGNEIYMTASIGISLAPEHGVTRTALLKAADMAMYRAKSLGKNQYQLFDEEIDRAYVRKMELERDLRKALANNELIIYYQPKWDSQHDCVGGMEALLRWQHPRLGLISPVEFIPIAEETGLIVSMTRWMLREVCLQNRTWQQRGLVHVCVSVNMSIRVFESGMLREMVADALEFSQLAPQDLELEITESIAMYDMQDTINQLQHLKALGVRVSMDDFGTGYSSLGSLDEMPIDALKIDQMFIRQSTLPSKRAIISTIIAIANHLNLEVVAEGVETEEQIGFLQSRGCRVMQGFYYGKPMDAQAIEGWIAATKRERSQTS
ncbi:bifunctional diguanylate cyclase/phosphodiesterase [Paenibacillus mendelii]|uniref:EAL domain-containing protein n=1 Tax=Paenibacillus mendelii TaxID=206163 RepID=A0ABV6J3Z2_9BACL|nr:bifunctional diguanylate cyclase/phosphodiesterase [Paenibacillus mendelii]MCQ6561868.1 EAL domain-containing protein [Paenibacillus mendelii]